MKRTSRYQGVWEPGMPVTHLHHVWDYITDRIKYCRRELSRCKAQYYGVGGDEETHGVYVCDLLKNTANSYDAVNSILRKSSNACDDLGLVDWAFSFRNCRERLVNLAHVCTEDIFLQLTHFCNNYEAIGVGDDRLFTQYRSKVHSTKKIKDKIAILLSYLQLDSLPVHSNEVPSDLLQCECHSGHTIARLLPITLDTFENYLDKFLDWLTVDKCYIDDLQDSIKKARKQLKTIEKQQKLSMVMHNTANTSLKKEKMVLEALKLEFASFDMRDLRESEKQCHRVTLEILALEHVIRSIDIETSRDVPDCCVAELEEIEEVSGASKTDRDYYSKRLEQKKHLMTELNEQIQDYKNLCSEKSQTEKQVRVLSKNLNKARKQRDKLVELRDSCHDKLSTLEQIYEMRIRPRGDDDVNCACLFV